MSDKKASQVLASTQDQIATELQWAGVIGSDVDTTWWATA
jgi:hypothetical protein